MEIEFINSAKRKIVKRYLERLPFGLGKRVLVPAIQLALSVPSLWRNNRPWPARLRFYFNLLRLLTLPFPKNKRLLGIWDFHNNPWSIGDPLVFVETLNCLSLKHQIEDVDICIIYDHDDPVGIRRESQLTPENARDYILNWLPLFSTCQNLSSVFQFKSRTEFNYCLTLNANRYMLSPTLGNHLGERYNFLGSADLTEIMDFYKNNGYIPYLRIGELLTSWAYDFFLSHIKPGTVPVVLSLKSTLHSQVRNADPTCWLPFIDRCESSFQDVTFVLVGLRDEEPPGIRQCANVIIAKDYGTTIMEDLALVQKATMYIATDSGIVVIAMFADTPYLVFQVPSVTMKKYNLVNRQNWCFATEHQKLFDDTFDMTPDFIFEEFTTLYQKLDKEKWFANANAKASPVSQHPSTTVIRHNSI